MSYGLLSLILSHAGLDRAAVDDVDRRLRAAGYSGVFLDHHPETGIRTCRYWEAERYSALRRADAVLFVGTAARVASRWRFAELAPARALGR